MKRFAFVALWLFLAGQIGWIVLNNTVLHRSPNVDAIGIGITVLLTVFAATRGRPGWLRVTVRIVMAGEFLLAVADRFGLLGAPGSGVYWGDFTHFVDYTASVGGFLPAALAPAAAVFATVAEIVL